MNRVRLVYPGFTLVAVLVMFFVPAGGVDADMELTWPVWAPLKVKDWSVEEEVWLTVGDVWISNTKEGLNVGVYVDEGYGLATVNIHVVQNPDDFALVLDRKGRVRPDSFDFRTDYLVDEGHLVAEHEQTIAMSELPFGICWGANPEACPPNLFFIVHTDLQVEETLKNNKTVWVDLPQGAFAENGGRFDRYLSEEEGVWGWYVSYPLARVEPGHFVDANVSGLTYSTPTQLGTTGDAGQFWYLTAERVAFWLGNLYLGDALGDRAITPMDLFGGVDIEDTRVLNMARLLQSLDADGYPGQGAISITESVVDCFNRSLPLSVPPAAELFTDDEAVGLLIDDTVAACAGDVTLRAVTKEEALENLNAGLKAGNIMKKNVSKTPWMKSDKAKLEIVPVYVPALRADGFSTFVEYHNADGEVIETRGEAKPIVVSYLDEVEGTGAMDVFVSISRDDGDTWMRRNISRTADKSSLIGYPGVSEKPMLKVKDNKIFVAWTDKYCRGGRPAYAITVCPDTTGDGQPDPCEVCRETAEGTVCEIDYPGDDAYWTDDLFGVGGPQRSVLYEDEPEVGEVPYSCVWTARAVVGPNGDVEWFKPERLTSGRRDAFQLFAAAATDAGFAIVWQEDPKGLMPGEGDGPGDGWSGANTHSKTDIWYSFIRLADFDQVDDDYPVGGFGENEDIVDTDFELGGRVKALVPMSLPVKVSDNDVCSLENISATGGSGEHDNDGEGEGTHRYCGAIENIGTAELPGSNPLCAYTVEKANPKGEIHNVCVTADGRLLDGNTGASRANLHLQPYKKPDGTKSAWAMIGYEESKGVGSPPEDEGGCGDEELLASESESDDHDRYKPDQGKNVIYHSFDFSSPVVVGGGDILNLPETDDAGNPVLLVDEFGALLLDWKGDPQLAYENARRVRFVSQPKGKKGPSGTVLVALYRQGEEGGGKPADIFMRRAVASSSGNPYAFGNFVSEVQNLSSVEPEVLFQDPFDAEAPVKMLRWGWSAANLADSSAKNPYTDSRAHRGTLDGDELIVGYTWTPNWGRRANDKYDFYVRRSFNGGQSWTTDPDDGEPIEHNVAFRVPILDYDTQTVIWDEEVVSTSYGAGEEEPARNVSNLWNNRTSVIEPRLVKTPGTITDPSGYPEDERVAGIYQLAYGLEFNQNLQSDGDPRLPLDIYYSRTRDKGQRYESVIVTPQGGTGRPQEGWNLFAKDKPEQGAAQIRQTPDGSRLYGIWLEEGEKGSDIMFRRVDYR